MEIKALYTGVNYFSTPLTQVYLLDFGETVIYESSGVTLGHLTLATWGLEMQTIY